MDTAHNRCVGSHRFFVSEVKGTSADDQVWVILVCTSCGHARRIVIPLDFEKPILQ
jgi:hypothetical protein